MRYRTNQFFLQQMYKEPAPDNIRLKLIQRYKKGGLDHFEDEWVNRMAGININQPLINDPITKDRLKWVYVGDSWWCRKRNKVLSGKKIIKKPHYEFGRFVAISNKGTKNEINGLWNSVIHCTTPEPIIVYFGDQKGRIIGRNEFEVYVKIGDGPVFPTKDINLWTFEFYDDFEEYKKIFANLRK